MRFLFARGIDARRIIVIIADDARLDAIIDHAAA